MRKTLLLNVVLLLQACQAAPSQLPGTRPLPEAVINPPSATTEGNLTSALQTSQNGLQEDLTKFSVDLQTEIQRLLDKAKR